MWFSVGAKQKAVWLEILDPCVRRMSAQCDRGTSSDLRGIVLGTILHEEHPHTDFKAAAWRTTILLDRLQAHTGEGHDVTPRGAQDIGLHDDFSLAPQQLC